MTTLVVYLIAVFTALRGCKILAGLPVAQELKLPPRLLFFGALAGLSSLAGGAASFWLVSLLPAVYGLVIGKMMVCVQWASPGRGAVLIFLAQAIGVIGSAWIASLLHDVGPLLEATVLGGLAFAWLLFVWNVAMRLGFAPVISQ